MMEIDKTCSFLPNSGQDRCQPSINNDFYRTTAVAILLVLTGSGMQGYANGTIDAFFVALLLFLAGFAVLRLVFPRSKPEMQVFILTYGVSVFAGGLAQCYSLNVFNNPQSTIDSFTFLSQISPYPPFMTMANMPLFNSPLAVVIWQQVYKLTWWLGLEFGPYTAVMFNAFVMGLTGSLTVWTARELFGDDGWRLRRVGNLFAFCGLFILFGAVLLRDCFVTFLNALVLWGLVRLLVRRTLWSLFLATVLIGISAYAMAYLRLQAVVLFGMYGFLAFLVSFFAKKKSQANMFTPFLCLCIMLCGTIYFLSQMQEAQNMQSKGMVSYYESALASGSEDSLGLQLILNQPLLIRMVLGSGSLMVSPIPLWANFKISSVDYLWIKGYHGIYQLLILPLVFAGFIKTFRMFRGEQELSIPLLFLAVYLLMNIAVVVATSLEQRHFAQFMPAAMILAALPDTRKATIRNKLQMIMEWWFAAVAFIHLAWMIIKG